MSADLADGADDLEPFGAGLELRALGLLVLLRAPPLRVDLLLPPRHPPLSSLPPPIDPEPSSPPSPVQNYQPRRFWILSVAFLP